MIRGGGERIVIAEWIGMELAIPEKIQMGEGGVEDMEFPGVSKK